MTKKLSGLALIACAALCAAVLAGCSNAAEKTVVVSEGNGMPTITVTANSEIKVVPDKAEIGVAVTTQAATADETQANNATDVNAVVDALKQLGIDEKSIQTSNTYLNPRYDYSQTYSTTSNGEVIVDDGAEDEGSNIVGYEMTTHLTVSDLDIDQVGEVLQACVAAGANNADGIRYYSSEYDTKYDEALAAAVESAHAKAEVLAQAGGISLGGVHSMTEGYQNTAYRYDSGVAMEAAVAEDSAMGIMPGEVNVTASVTVSYQIA